MNEKPNKDRSPRNPATKPQQPPQRTPGEVKVPTFDQNREDKNRPARKEEIEEKFRQGRDGDNDKE